MFSGAIEDLVGLSDEGLDTSIRELELEHRAVIARMACAIAVADARRLNAVDGHRSMKGYLRATCSWFNREVARMRSLARLVDRHAEVGDALLSGRLGGPQAFELAKVHGNARVADRFGEFVPILVAAAEELPYDDFRVAVQRFTLRADPDGAHRDVDTSVEHRDARMVHVGGSVDFRMTGGDPLITAELLSIFNGFVDTEFAADLAARRAEHGDAAECHELGRTTKQRRHDAVAAIFRAAHVSVTEGKVSDPLVNIVVDADTFARVMTDAGLTDNAGVLDDLMAESDLASVRCETTSGVVLHPHHVLRSALTGHVRRVVIDSDGVVIDQGRKQRLFTGAAREAALLLVRHCEHPGCDLPAEWCQVDHADEWADGGVTDQANARARCGGHNREKHRKQLRSKRATNGKTYTIRSDDSIMLPVGARPPTLPDNDDSGSDDSGIDDPADVIRLTRFARQRLADLPRLD